MDTKKTDIEKFSIPEIFNNSDGKTSGSKVAGFVIIVTGCLCLLACVVGLFKKLDVTGFAGIVAGAIITGAGLMGYSKNQSLKFGGTDNGQS